MILVYHKTRSAGLELLRTGSSSTCTFQKSNKFCIMNWNEFEDVFYIINLKWCSRKPKGAYLWFQVFFLRKPPGTLWRLTYISPVHKGGRRYETVNYRPISITSAVGKILEGIVNSTVIQHLTWGRLFSLCQHNFSSATSVEIILIVAYINDNWHCQWQSHWQWLCQCLDPSSSNWKLHETRQTGFSIPDAKYRTLVKTRFLLPSIYLKLWARCMVEILKLIT